MIDMKFQLQPADGAGGPERQIENLPEKNRFGKLAVKVVCLQGKPAKPPACLHQQEPPGGVGKTIITKN